VKKLPAFLLLLFLGLASLPALGQQYTDAAGSTKGETPATPEQTVGQIICTGLEKNAQGATRQFIHRGTVQVLTSDDLITCAHVVHGARQVFCSVQGKSFLCVTTKEDEAFDIAHLSPVEKVSLRTPALSKGYEFSKDSVLTGYGFGKADDPRTTAIGQILNNRAYTPVEVSGKIRKLRTILTNAEYHPGMSGGGVFNAKGELVGIITGINEKSHYGFILPFTPIIRPKGDDLQSDVEELAAP
jgi:S1-C subfamily serine protease